MRYARIAKRPGMAVEADSVARYLPGNYQIAGETGEVLVIEGEDTSGWTLDSYVLPRLASGLIFGEEITADEAKRLLLSPDEDFVAETFAHTDFNDPKSLRELASAALALAEKLEAERP